MAAVFNPPPGWPTPPSGWTPQPGWSPDPSWPPAPAGWQFWVPAPHHADRSSALSPRVAALCGWGGLALATLLGLTSGISGALMFAGFFTFVVAAVALAKGGVNWAHLPTRAAGGIALVGSVVAMSAGVVFGAGPGPSATATNPASEPTALPSAVVAPSASPTGTASPTTTDPAKSGTALALLGTLAVKGRAPMTGYSRAAFGAAWTDIDRNGCDQRNDTLRRDLQAITLKAGTNGCAVMTGRLRDPYTATTIQFIRTSTASSAVQIDHVVPLADAWAKGAQGWDQAKRTQFANDTLNLAAVSAKVNAAKGAGDAATWLPPAKAYRCVYVARQVAVKAKYTLAVTAAERTALADILASCPTTKVPSVTVPKLGGFPLYQAPAPTPSAKPAPAPSSKPVPKPLAPKPAPIQRGVHPGAFCSTEGALGYTNRGTLMRCSTKPGDRRRWRAA